MNEASPNNGSGKPLVVLVDDDPAVLNSLKFSLEIEGFAVDTYASGEAMLAAPVPKGGCLILDYAMPGMNGLDLLARLRERGVAMPAILITSHPSGALKARAAAAGVGIVEKPLLGNFLSEAIDTVLQRGAARH